MSYAFRTLRPLFRERGKITAEVTGRLNQALGGVRVVKTYTAERREDLVFTKGAHSLFRNVAKSMTGVSGTTAFSSVVIGAIGIVMMLVGGQSIVNGTMTLGDLFAYIFFTGLLAMPIVQIASIGTQITEAFAGLDRIHEILQTPREDADDANRMPLEDLAGDIEFDGVWFEYNAGRAGAEGRHVSRAGRDDDGARWIVGIGQEHADQSRHGVQPADAGRRPRRRPRSERAAPDRVSPPSRRRAAGQLPVRWHGRREHPLRHAARDLRGHRAREPDRACRRVHREVREGLRDGRRRARRPAVRRPAAARRDRARDPRQPARSCCSTRRRRASTARAKR